MPEEVGAGANGEVARSGLACDCDGAGARAGLRHKQRGCVPVAPSACAARFRSTDPRCTFIHLKRFACIPVHAGASFLCAPAHALVHDARITIAVHPPRGVVCACVGALSSSRCLQRRVCGCRRRAQLDALAQTTAASCRANTLPQLVISEIAAVGATPGCVVELPFVPHQIAAGRLQGHAHASVLAGDCVTDAARS